MARYLKSFRIQLIKQVTINSLNSADKLIIELKLTLDVAVQTVNKLVEL